MLWWFLPYIHMNQPWVYICSPSGPSLPPPSPSYPSGSSSAPALSTLPHASNLDWQSISRMIIYMFQCYSLKSFHLCFLPQSPKVCSLHPCLFCCLTFGSLLTIFVNSICICVNVLYWCFSFWLTSLCIIGSSFIHLIRTDSNASFLIWVVFYNCPFWEKKTIKKIFKHLFHLSHFLLSLNKF